jgi:hypothetical protein
MTKEPKFTRIKIKDVAGKLIIECNEKEMPVISEPNPASQYYTSQLYELELWQQSCFEVDVHESQVEKFTALMVNLTGSMEFNDDLLQGIIIPRFPGTRVELRLMSDKLYAFLLDEQKYFIDTNNKFGEWLSPVPSERENQLEILKSLWPNFPNDSPLWQYMNGLLEFSNQLLKIDAEQPKFEPKFDEVKTKQLTPQDKCMVVCNSEEVMTCVKLLYALYKDVDSKTFIKTGRKGRPIKNPKIIYGYEVEGEKFELIFKAVKTEIIK